VRAASACSATLKRATLVLGQSTPDACILTGLDGPLQAGVYYVAATAYCLRFFDLKECWSGVANWEEKFWVFFEALGAVTPIHCNS
jgi:hypothetical protein